MSTIKSSAEDLTINADGSNEIKFQINAVEKASINSSGLLTSTTIDATALTGNLPAIDGSSLTGVGGGKVIQVVNGTTNSLLTSSSSTLADTGLTAAITPANSANKILVIVTQGGLRKMTGNTMGKTVLMRDINGAGFSQLDDIGANEWGYTASTDRIHLACLASTFLDSPSATTSCTYKTQFSSVSNIASVSVQDGSGRSSITLMELDYS